MKLEDQLQTALENIANTPPIEDPGAFDPNLTSVAPSTHRSSKRLLASAAAIGALGIGGLAIAVGRDTPPPVEEPALDPSLPTMTLPPATPAVQPGPDGALLLPAVTGMNLKRVEEGQLAGDTPIYWYATPTAQPETSTYLRVVAFDNVPFTSEVPAEDVTECSIDGETPGSISTLADGTPTCLEDRDPSNPTGVIQFSVDQFDVTINGNATDDQLVTAAENLSPASLFSGFEIDPAGLPPGVEFIGTSLFVSDFATTDVSQADSADMILANFVDDESRLIFYLATQSSSPVLDTYRLGFSTVADVTVRGEPGFIRTLDNEPNYLGLVWHEDGTTYQVGSQELAKDELLAIVEQLETVTRPAWQTAIASIPPIEQTEEVMEEDPVTTTILIED